MTSRRLQLVSGRIVSLLHTQTRTFQKPVVELLAKDGDPYVVLVSTMLSLRTKDATTVQSSLRLLKRAPNLQALSTLPVATIARLIYPVGFYKTKARHLNRMSEIVLAEHGGTIPSDEPALLRLPGVGRKTAALVQSAGFGIPAICVDTHVHRISNRLGLVKTTAPHETEAALKHILSKKHWQDWNMLLVMWGQRVCTPVSPWCSRCALRIVCKRRGITSSR